MDMHKKPIRKMKIHVQKGRKKMEIRKRLFIKVVHRSVLPINCILLSAQS